MILDEKAIKEKWESPCTDSSINPDSPFAFELEVAHAQARAIYEWGNEICIQHKPFPPAKLKKRHECFKCWQQLEAELNKAEGK